MATAEDWQNELRRWLGPFLSHLGHKARRRMCPLYVAGLIGPGERKSVQPMASRTPAADYDQLHHFVGAGIWDEAPLERELIVQADRLVGGADAVLVIDDTALPKKGKHSVGVAPQYATVLGKQANCQTLVSLTLARREVPVPLALRLYLPEVWTEDPARLVKAGVPEPAQRHRSKSEIALAELDRVLGAEVRFGVVLADAAYGSSSGFRHALSQRGLTWAVGIPRTQKVYSLEVGLTWPVAPRTSAPEARPRHQACCGARDARTSKMADRHMAAWYQGPAQSHVRGGAGSRRGRHPDPRWRTVAPAPPRQGGGLARGRAPFDRRAQVLPLELADRDAAENPRRHH
jgi:SRSO17 transposase